MDKEKLKLRRANHHFQVWQLEWLEKYRLQTGTSGAELLRKLLSEYIKDKKKEIYKM